MVGRSAVGGFAFLAVGGKEGKGKVDAAAAEGNTTEFLNEVNQGCEAPKLSVRVLATQSKSSGGLLVFCVCVFRRSRCSSVSVAASWPRGRKGFLRRRGELDLGDTIKFTEAVSGVVAQFVSSKGS